jgi:hypothetical protein
VIEPESHAVIVRVLVKFYRRNGRQMILARDDASGRSHQAAPAPNNELAAMSGKAWQWQELLESGEFSTRDELGRAHGVNRTCVSRVLKLTSLIPFLLTLRRALNLLPEQSEWAEPMVSLCPETEEAGTMRSCRYFRCSHMPNQSTGFTESVMRSRRLVVFIALGLNIACMSTLARADLYTLYNDTLGNLPGQQPWLVYADNSFMGGTASQSAIASGVELTTDNTVSAGYSNTLPIVNRFKNPAFPTLDRQAGFELSFELLLVGESHLNPQRAGFSVLLLASDTQGIELGFWENEIWEQTDNPLFQHGTGIAFDTTRAEVQYRLRIVGDQYQLSANGTPLLTNSLRKYSAFGSAPYTLGSYLFLGDNTSSASATSRIGHITLTTIPEPSMLWLSAAGLVTFAGTCRVPRHNEFT